MTYQCHNCTTYTSRPLRHERTGTIACSAECARALDKRHCQCQVKHPVRITHTGRICTGCRRERI